MPTPLTRLPLAGLVTIMATGALVAGSARPTVAAAADADLRVIGGNASSAIVCGNVAAAQDLARQRGIVLQKNNCTAKAAGGGVMLQNVDIYISGAARVLNRDNPVLAALAAPTPPGVAQDKCENHRPSPGPGKQINKCWVLAQGGKVNLNNVRLVDQQDDASTVTRTIDNAAVPPATVAPP